MKDEGPHPPGALRVECGGDGGSVFGGLGTPCRLPPLGGRLQERMTTAGGERDKRAERRARPEGVGGIPGRVPGCKERRRRRADQRARIKGVEEGGRAHK